MNSDLWLLMIDYLLSIIINHYFYYIYDILLLIVIYWLGCFISTFQQKMAVETSFEKTWQSN